jgi:hypothetical protein
MNASRVKPPEVGLHAIVMIIGHRLPAFTLAQSAFSYPVFIYLKVFLTPVGRIVT